MLLAFGTAVHCVDILFMWLDTKTISLIFLHTIGPFY